MAATLSLPSRKDLLSAILDEAGLTLKADILVAGPNAFATLIWLCRHGFETVAYVRPGAAVHGDALLILHTIALPELSAILTDGRVEPGGLVVVKTSAGLAPEVDALLEHNGLRVERRIRRGRHEIHLARRPAAQALSRAA